MSLVWLSCYKKLKHEIEDAAKEEQLLLKQRQEVLSSSKSSKQSRPGTPTTMGTPVVGPGTPTPTDIPPGTPPLSNSRPHQNIEKQKKKRKVSFNSIVQVERDNIWHFVFFLSELFFFQQDYNTHNFFFNKYLCMYLLYTGKKSEKVY